MPWFVEAKVLLVTLGLVLTAQAVESVSAERRDRDRWVRAHWLEAPRAISFTVDGRPSDEVLAGWRSSRKTERLDPERVRHVLTWADPVGGLEVRCAVVVFREPAAVEWVLSFANTGAVDTPLLERVRCLETRVPRPPEGVCLHYSLGDHNSARSFEPATLVLPLPEGGERVFAPNGGRSSDPTLPYFNLDAGGGGVVLAIGWSGQWEAGFGPSGTNAVAVRAGQQRTRFRLHPGETVRSPSVQLVFWRGPDALRGNNLFRQLQLAHFAPRVGGERVYPPICASVNNTDPDGSYEGPHVRVMPALARRGFEVFWSDMDPQHWYPGDFPQGTGNWVVDEKKYPRGLGPVGQAARAAGLGYLLWFEPERVAPGTRIAREHPEFVHGGSGGGLFKFGDPTAWRWMLELLDRTVTEAGITWVRWDFNMEPLKYWRESDAEDRQGIAEIRHVEGLYAMWDELRRRHPGLMIDNCASGGRRIDIETGRRSLPLWHSDMICFKPNPAGEQLQNAGLYRWVPFHACGTFGYEPSYSFRSGMCGGNIVVGVGGDGHLSTAYEETEEAARRTTAVYRVIRPYLTGDFHPLFPHEASEAVWFGYQFHRPSAGEGMAVLFRREQAAEAERVVPLQSIEPRRLYSVRFEDTPGTMTVRGKDLSQLKVRIPTMPGSAIVYYGPAKRR
ncbi:MAG TPA: alpha-galactosidase [Verrucomicrobiota bacterium]|nr:alpha-galactosidase [Verrucomicrobiota bacterium]